jgi:two-component system, sensor histidine kinase and response regulator
MRLAHATPYVVAVAVVLITIGLNQWIHPWVKRDHTQLLFFDAAILVSAWFGNWRAGLITYSLSIGTVFFLSPEFAPGDPTTAAWLQAGVLAIEGGLILAVVAALHRARERAESSRRETAQSVAEREAADRSLRSTRVRFRRLVEANIIGVFFCEEDGRVFEANQSFLSLLGYTEEDVRAGRLNIAGITPPEFIDTSIAATVELASDGRCQPYEKELFHKDGRRIPVLIGSALLVKGQGQSVSFALDLTEQKATERELQNAKDEAENANRLKSDFLTNMSHELRTPMNAMLGMTQLALDEDPPTPLREYLDTALESGHALLTLVNAILDFSKMETGRFELEMLPFELRKLLEEAIQSLAAQTKGRNLDLKCDVAEEVPDHLLGDAQRLRQVIVNLVGNGIKFTSEGEVCLAVRLGSRTSDEVVLHFAVSDTGIGISAADQQRIFAPFMQVDNSTTRRYGGTGLGLAIASDLIRMHGGQLRLSSEPGQGSTFSFDARFALASSAAPAVSPAIATSLIPKRNSPPLKILLAEDTPASRKVVCQILQKRGHEVRIAVDGQQAVDAVKQAKFDVVLMDVQMPHMDGLQATATIRATEPMGAPPLPIIAMTAHAMKGDRQRCLAAGMNAYLAKPIDVFKLIELVESMAGDGADRWQRTMNKASERAANDPVRDADGASPPPDSSLPRDASSSATCASDARADSTKETAVTNPTQSSSLSHAQRQAPPMVTCDLDAALRRLGQKKSLLIDMIGFFLEDAPVLLQDIQQGVASGDADAAARAAHSLKGLAANFDAESTTQAALRIEQLAKLQQLANIPPELETLQAATTHLMAELMAAKKAL